MIYQIFIVVAGVEGCSNPGTNTWHFYLLAVAAAELQKARQAVVPEVKW